MGASLDEERCGQSEQEKPSTPPRAQSTAQSAFAGDDRKQVKSTPAPRRKGRKDRALAAESRPSSAGRTGPCVYNEDLTDTVQNWPSVVGRAGPLVYDDEFDASSPPVVDLTESMATPSVYCPGSPSIMSVHMPGSPTPRSMMAPAPMDLLLHGFEAAFELEPDTDSSVVIVGEHHMAARPAARPCRVRVECRGDGTDNNKHAPQAPCQRPLGTGKLSSRPLGCTYLAANFGG